MINIHELSKDDFIYIFKNLNENHLKFENSYFKKTVETFVNKCCKTKKFMCSKFKNKIFKLLRSF